MRVGNVQQQEDDVRIYRILQRGAEGTDQMVRQFANESYRIGQQNRLPAGQGELARCRIERGKQLVLCQNAGTCQRVEQGGFARVGVADDGDAGQTAPVISVPRPVRRGAVY